MSLYIQNLANGDADEKGHFRLLGTLLTQSGVIQAGAFEVSAQGSPDMTVKVAGGITGHDIAFLNTDGALYHGWNTANENVTITANATGVTKKDAIVAYADLTAGISTPNSPGALKLIAVRGSGTNTAPDDTQIRASAVGATNPYVVLAHVTVANGASSINSGNIVDQRPRAWLNGQLLEAESVDTPQLAPGAVTFDKTDGIWWEELGRATLGATGDTLTVNLSSGKRFMRILALVSGTGNILPNVRFNGDTGNNYYYSYSVNNGSATAANAQNALPLHSQITSSQQFFAVIDTMQYDVTSAVRLVHRGGQIGAAAMTSSQGSGMWVGGAKATSVTLFNSATGDFNADATQLIVLGHD